MSRLRMIKADRAGGPQGQFVRSILAPPRGSRMRDSDGHLIGPFNAWAYAPEITIPLAEFGRVLRQRSSLSAIELEVAILHIAAHWRSDFEWFAHVKHAEAAGVPHHWITAIAEARGPAIPDSRVAAVSEVCSGALSGGRLDDSVYERAVSVLSEVEMIELVLLLGYYCTVSLTLNVFAVSAGELADPPWS